MEVLPKKKGKLNGTHSTKTEGRTYSEVFFRMHVIPVCTAKTNRKMRFSGQVGPTLQADSAGVSGWTRSRSRMLSRKVAEPPLCAREKR